MDPNTQAYIITTTILYHRELYCDINKKVNTFYIPPIKSIQTSKLINNRNFNKYNVKRKFKPALTHRSKRY
jgi:hypothetical protein